MIRKVTFCLLATCSTQAIAQTPEGAQQPVAETQAKEAGDEIIVTGTRAEGYVVSKTEALGLPIATAELPASVSIVSDDLLEDLGARSLATVLPYVAGVSNADNGGVNTDNFNIRGFASSNNYVNGIRQSITAEGRPSLNSIERVEIVKGPAGVEGSLTSPGGFVNIVTKKPKADFGGEIYASVGDANFYRGGVDITGPIVGDVILARLNASFEDKQQWRPGRRNRPIVTIAPSILVKPTQNTDVLFEYEYRRQNDPLDRGTIFARGIRPDSDFLPRDFSFHQEFDELKLTNQRFDVDVVHRFSDNFKARLHYQRVTQKDKQLAVRNADSEGDGALFEADGITYSGNQFIDIFLSDASSQLKSESWIGELTGNFNLGSTEHVINLGGSLAENTDDFGSLNGDYTYLSGVASYDVFAPTDQLTFADFTFGPNGNGERDIFANFVRGDKIDSAYGQWLGRWTDRFRTIVSLRYDNIRTFARDDISDISPSVLQRAIDQGALDPDNLFNTSAREDTISYRVAASYDVTGRLTAFAGYAKSAEPQSGFTRAGDSIGTISNRSIEGGLKMKLNGGAALATLTGYSIERSNIAIVDPSNDPNESFLVPLGSARINGIELELTGKLTKTISVFSGISVQDSKITGSGDPIVGNAFANVPKFQASLFVNWNGADLGLAALDVGLGISYQGRRQANSANQYQLPGYERVDLGISYAFAKNFEARFQINNLFDKTYYTAAQDSIFGSDQIAVGDKRLIQFTVTRRF
jgi:iron complex outermembrane receptor protein